MHCRSVCAVVLVGLMAAACSSPGRAEDFSADIPTVPDRGRVWQPKKPPAPAAEEAHSCRIVSYADKWSRHGFGGHGRGSCQFRFARNSWRRQPEPDPWPFVFSHDRDVDGDGRTDDDTVVALPFSMEQQLGIPAWPYSGTFPERHNWRFFGGTVQLRANTRREGWKNEMGINCEHSGPWFDPRAEDHPLAGAGDPMNKESYHRHYWCFLWKKEDFMNGGDRYRVSFDENSRLAAICTRTYWIGYDDVRLVVQNGDRFYISDNGTLDIPGPDNGPSLPGKTFGAGRVFSVRPTQVTWAEYHPRDTQIDFDPDGARFTKRDFDDVRAVGWYLAKNNTKRLTTHCKWYGFEADAVVHRPETHSALLDMVRIQGDGDVPAFDMATCEVPYELWRRVHRWGDSPFWTLEGRFVYRRNGDMGSMQRPAGKHSQQEPVTNLTWYDLLAFCNTMSRYEGREPVYYTDPGFTNVFRNMHIATRAYGWEPSGEDWHNPSFDTVPEPTIYVKWAADGFRLPTLAEWLKAHGRGRVSPTTGRKTPPVGSRKPNSRGIHDMLGNVWEPVWPCDGAFDPDVKRMVVVGGDFQHPADPTSAECTASPWGDMPYDGNFNIGIRLVRRDAGLPEPAIGPVPASSGHSTVQRDVPVWCFTDGERTDPRVKAAPTEPLPDMVELDAGWFTRYPDKTDIYVHPLAMSKFEITYEQWVTVLHWAEANGYSFSLDGDMGSMYWLSHDHGPKEPVMHLMWYDMLVWCNALSEMQGLTPVYYAAEARTEVYRDAYAYRALKASGPELVSGENPWHEKYQAYGPYQQIFLFAKWDADGYRLPTAAEWEYAARGGTQTNYFWGEDRAGGEQYGWDYRTSGGRTHPVGLKKPNGFGLYDIYGNAGEMLWSLEMGHPPTKKSHPRNRDINNPKDSPYYAYDGYRRSAGSARAMLGGTWLAGSLTFNRNHGVNAEHAKAVGPTFYYPDVGFRIARSLPVPYVEMDDTKYAVVGPHRERVRELSGKPVRVEGTVRGGSIELTAIEATGGEAMAGVGIPHTADGREKLQEDIPTVYIKPERIEDYDPHQDRVFRGNLARTGVYETSGLAELGGVRWKHDAGAPVRSSPVVVDGTLYVGFGCVTRADGKRLDGGLLALDAETGKERWRLEVSGGVESTPAVRDGRVFFGGNDQVFYAVDAGSGQVLWQHRGDHRDQTAKVSPTVAYGVVFTGLRGKMRGYDAKTGEQVWVSSAEMPVDTRGSMAVAGNAAYYTGHHAWGRLYRLNVSTGRVKWEESAKGLYNTPAVVGNLVYFQDADHLKVCNTGTGEPVWDAYLDKEVGVNEMRVNSSPTVWRDLVVVGLDRGSVHALDAASGEPWWTFETRESFRSSPALTPENGLLYLGCNDGNLYALRAEDGKVTWQFETEGPVESSPWPGDGVIYVGSDDGHVYALH